MPPTELLDIEYNRVVDLILEYETVHVSSDKTARLVLPTK